MSIRRRPPAPFHVSLRDLHLALGETIQRVQVERRAGIITRHGKPVAIIKPVGRKPR